MQYLFRNLKTDCSEPKSLRLNVSRHPYQYLSEQETQKLIQDLPSLTIAYVPPMQRNDYENLLKENSKRFNSPQTNNALETHPLCNIKNALINSVCAPSIVEHIKKELFKRYT